METYWYQCARCGRPVGCHGTRPASGWIDEPYCGRTCAEVAAATACGDLDAAAAALRWRLTRAPSGDGWEYRFCVGDVTLQWLWTHPRGSGRSCSMLMGDDPVMYVVHHLRGELAVPPSYSPDTSRASAADLLWFWHRLAGPCRRQQVV